MRCGAPFNHTDRPTDRPCPPDHQIIDLIISIRVTVIFWCPPLRVVANKGMYEGVTAGRMIPTDRPTAWGGEEICSGVTDEIDETDRS